MEANPDIPALRLHGIDLREVAPQLVVLELQAQVASENVKMGPNVFVNKRPLSPLVFQASKEELRRMLQDLIDRLDELS